MPSYNIGSLFAGIGGIDRGFQDAGFKIKWSNEIDKKACKTFSVNFSHKMYSGDIKNLIVANLSKVDVLTAGFPCQPFSIAGYRKGLMDERGGAIFFQMMRIIKGLKPRVIFLENVKNLTTHDKGRTLKIIMEALIEAGYQSPKYAILNTCEYSQLPQNRERLFIVGFKYKKDQVRFNFPEKEKKQKTIKQLLETKIPEKFYYDQLGSKIFPTLQKAITRVDTCYQWRRKYVRENKSNMCPTLTANMGTGGHNVPLILDKGRIRKLTPKECAKFQGFPKDFILPENMTNSDLYKQIGNSVSVPVVTRIAHNILEAISNS
jgi:DNA (cytosine-5)-methyltransferase 1